MIEPMPTAEAEHILITVGPRSKESARELANRIEREARAGVRFTELVSRWSECPSRNRGGDLGRVGPGDCDPDLEAVLFEMPVGELGVVETRHGFHVVRRRA